MNREVDSVRPPSSVAPPPGSESTEERSEVRAIQRQQPVTNLEALPDDI